MIYTSLSSLFLLSASSLAETLVVASGIVMLAVYGVFLWKTRNPATRSRWLPMR
jgi:hypothetical protein